jgi:hypothetical protein
MSKIGRLQTWLYIAGTCFAAAVAFRVSGYSVHGSNILLGIATVAITVGFVVEYRTTIRRIRPRWPWLVLPDSEIPGVAGMAMDLETAYLRVKQEYNSFDFAFHNLKEILENDEEFQQIVAKRIPVRSLAEPFSPKQIVQERAAYADRWQALFVAASDFRDVFRYLR